MIVAHQRLIELTRTVAPNTEVPFVADVEDEKLLTKLEEERHQTEETIKKLAQQREVTLAEIKAASEIDLSSAQGEFAVESDAVVQCPMCTREQPLAAAAKHMPQCFRQIESKMSLSGPEESNLPELPFAAFCNHYDKQTRSFCKRIRDVCIEHDPGRKLAKGGLSKVCGCPMDGINEKSPEDSEVKICMLPAKQCLRHLGWEFARLGDTCQEALSNAFSLQYTHANERSVHARIRRRATVLPCVFHQTLEVTTDEQRAAIASESRLAYEHKIQVQGEEHAQEWRKRQEEIDPPSKDEIERPRITAGTADLPRRHWR